MEVCKIPEEELSSARVRRVPVPKAQWYCDLGLWEFLGRCPPGVALMRIPDCDGMPRWRLVHFDSLGSSCGPHPTPEACVMGAMAASQK